MKRRLALLLGAVAVVSTVTPSVANAVQSVTSGSYTCKVTSVAPALSKTTLTAKVTVICNVATSVSVEIGAVEVDAATATFQQVIVQTKKSVAVKANTSVTVSVSGACTNTETGYEEYATKARVSIGATAVWSLYDQSIPKDNSFNC